MATFDAGDLLLPKGWQENTKRAMVSLMAMTHYALVDVRQFIGRCITTAGTAPKYLVCDKGVQFWNEGFKRWCKRKAIKPRYGAIGKHGSIAVIERFIRSLKYEYLNRLLDNAAHPL
jgi:transposase InsO family protein